MKKIAALFCILISFSFVVPHKTSNCAVKYNGIYACKLDNEHSAIIRFYEDGTVLASTSVNDYRDVFSWFHKENKDMVLKGTYKIKNVRLNLK